MACVINVAINDDSRFVREGITAMLRELPDIRVVLASTSADVGQLHAQRPDVVLMDVRLQDAHSLRVAETMRVAMPRARVIVMDLLPMHDEIAQFVNAGVAGFILKDATPDDFIGTLRAVAGGLRVLPARMTGTLFSQIASAAVHRAPAAAPDVALTAREREVIALIAQGRSNKEIAADLHVAAHTVKSHVRNVMDKLALHSRLQIAAYAHERH